MNYTFNLSEISEVGILETVTKDQCVSAIKGAQYMNKFYILGCVSLFILWVLTAYKAGMLDKEVAWIRKWFK